jgi:hypothetical protein
VHFDLGNEEELLTLFHQTGSTSGNNWSGYSSKMITDGTLTPNAVPEPVTVSAPLPWRPMGYTVASFPRAIGVVESV